MLLFAAVGMVFFAACEDKTPTEIGEKPGEEQPGEEDPKEDPEPIAGTR